MSYNRVIPRDLFNEANLLKCLGRLAILTEGMASVSMTETEGVDPFVIDQNPASGGITCTNVTLIVRGRLCLFERPLNNRQPWPLYLIGYGGEDLDDPFPVFDDAGNLSPEMEQFLA